EFKEIKPPSWALFVKTSAHKQRAPDDKEWWYTRSASVLRRVYVRGPVGVSRMRTVYGGRKNRGSKPEHFFKSSGTIIRNIFKQLEDAGLIKKTEKGRVITPKGRSLIDKTAYNIYKLKSLPSKKTGSGKSAKKPSKKKATSK
ncbi:MAG: 30S ribosomal protein S19e, partial [Candidatus Odinarchaeia archaeon]